MRNLLYILKEDSTLCSREGGDLRVTLFAAAAAAVVVGEEEGGAVREQSP